MDSAIGSAESVSTKIAHATGVVYAPDVIAELLLFDPAFEVFVDRLVQTPDPIEAMTAQEETLIERAERMLEQYQDVIPSAVEHPGT